MNKFIEQYYPLLLSFVGLVVMYLIDSSFLKRIDFKELIGSTLVVFSVILGFLLTITTLLHTIENKKMLIIKQTETYPRLVDFLKQAVYLSLIISFLSLIIPLFKNMNVNFKFEPKLFVLCFKYIYLFLLFFTSFCTIRFINIFLSIISDKKK